MSLTLQFISQLTAQIDASALFAVPMLAQGSIEDGLKEIVRVVYILAIPYFVVVIIAGVIAYNSGNTDAIKRAVVAVGIGLLALVIVETLHEAIGAPGSSIFAL